MKSSGLLIQWDQYKNKLFTDLNFEVFGFVFWSNDNVAAFTTFSSRIW